MAESEEELKSLSMKVKEECEKVGLKLNIQKTKIMASSPITPWQIDGQKLETVTDFIFLGSKITTDGDWVTALTDWLILSDVYNVEQTRRDWSIETSIWWMRRNISFGDCIHSGHYCLFGGSDSIQHSNCWDFYITAIPIEQYSDDYLLFKKNILTPLI